MTFNIEQLIEDCGGAAALARDIGVSRTTPYRWIQQGMISSRMLVAIKKGRPDITIDDYIQGEKDVRQNVKRSAGVSG